MHLLQITTKARKKPIKKCNNNAYSRCGLAGHWIHACRTSKHFVDFYQETIKGKGKRFETHTVEMTMKRQI